MKKFIPLLLLSFTFQFEYIKYEEEGQISIITINRPKALNALNNQVLEELEDSLDSIDKSKVHAVIITGAGEKSFVAGGDIAEMSTLSKEFGKIFSQKGSDIFRKLEKFEIPVIAAINGITLGGGCELSLSCDIRICSDNAIFGQPEVGLGIIPGFGGTQRLPRIIGAGMAKQMIFTGQNINAEEALRIGLVNAVYPQNELLNEAKKLALNIAKNSLNAVKNSKKAINEGIQVDIDKGFEIESQLFGDCFENLDQFEGMTKFLEKGNNNKVVKKHNLQQTLQIQIQNEEILQGELVLTDKFKNMIYLQEFTTPNTPAILSAGDKDKYNSMTIQWGSLGVAFTRPVFTVYVKPDRYTYEFMEKTEYFTVSIINKKLFNKFEIYGTKSGKDINKEEVAGTHIKFLDNGGITFEEAEEVFVCKLFVKSYIKENEVDPSIIELYKSKPTVYKTLRQHSIYMGEIIGHYVRKK